VARITAVVVPYELGRLRQGVGCGPEHLLARGAEAALASSGAAVRRDVIELDPQYGSTGLGEGDAAFELIRLVAGRVEAARAKGAFPVVLSGSCFAAVGVVAGLGEAAPGVVWFDSHADFNEPATTISGYTDGMGLAILTGSAWQAMLATVPGAIPVPESAVVLAGARALDPPEEVRLRASRIARLEAAELASPDALLAAVAGLDPAVTGLYVHIDLDVLDSAVARVNVYSEPDGPGADELDALLAALLRTHPVRAVSLTAYDPAFDADDRVPPIALRLLRTLAAAI
jgi:arginase